MKNEEYKKLSIAEFTKAAGRYESNQAGVYEMCKKDYQVLRNGLDKDENEILFNSINIPEIISLILKGINKAFNY